MSLDRIRATGSGEYSWRLRIDGLPYQPVSNKKMELGSEGDLVIRRSGLSSRGLRLEERVHPAIQRPRHASQRAQIADTERRWSRVFFRQPEHITWLRAQVDDSVTTIPVESTAGWPTSGSLWLDNEAMRYTGVTADTFTGVTRGAYGTLAAYHYTSVYGTAGLPAERRRYPEVASWIRGIEGRRAHLYIYGEGDDPQGDGTRIWIGTVNNDIRYDGLSFDISLAPIWRQLENDIGGELAEAGRIRGAYYPALYPLILLFRQRTGTTPTAGTLGPRAGLALAGFFESQEEFCSDLTTEIASTLAAPVSGTGSFAIGDGLSVERPALSGYEGDIGRDSGWVLCWDRGGVSRDWLHVLPAAGLPGDAITLQAGVSLTDGSIHPWSGGVGGRPVLLAQDSWLRSDGREVTSSADEVGERLYRPLRAAKMPTWELPIDVPGHAPRTIFGFLGGSGIENARPRWDTMRERLGFLDEITRQVGMSSADHPAHRLYLADGVGGANVVRLSWEDRSVGEGVSVELPVGASDAGDQWVEATLLPTILETSEYSADGAPLASGPIVDVGGADLEVQVGQQLTRVADGNISTFLQAVLERVPIDMNLGLVPELRFDDFDPFVFSFRFRDELSASEWWNGRGYTYWGSVKLSDIITEELRGAGWYPALTSEGKINFKPLSPISRSERTVATIGPSTVATDRALLTIEKGPFGIYNAMELARGYDPVEGEHTLPMIRGRDLSALATGPSQNVIPVAPLSTDPADKQLTIADVVGFAERYTAIFGWPYLVLDVDVKLVLLDVLLGDRVLVAWDRMPTREGVVDRAAETRVGWVLGRSVDFAAARGALSIYLPETPLAGYVPEFLIESQTNVSGDIWDLEPAAGYLPEGQTPADFWSAGDKVRLIRWGSATATGMPDATVVSASASLLRVETATTWTVGATDWMVTSADSTAVSSENQKRFVYIADSAGRLEFEDETVAARRLGP